jgi:hypothetical protein
MDKKESVEVWLKKQGNPYKKILWDEPGTLAVSSGVRALPETFLIYQGQMFHHSGTLSSLKIPKI